MVRYGIILSFYYYQIGNHQKRVETLKKALEVYRLANADKLKLANVCHNIGLAYRAMTDYEKSINYHLKALDYKVDSLGEFNNLSGINLSSTWTCLSRYESGEKGA